MAEIFKVKKQIEFSASHRLDLDYLSKCTTVHGHNWQVTVCCQSSQLNNSGMIVDFTEIKDVVKKLDHKDLNEILPFNPTAENIAKWLCDQIPYCYKVTVQESQNNEATYEKILD